MNTLVKFTAPRRLRLRVEDFLVLVDADAFTDHAKTELIGGELVYMNAQYRPHAYAKTRLAFLLETALRSLDSPLAVIVEGSVAMPPYDVPEPDIALTSDPLGLGPMPITSIALLVEVADSTRAFDLDIKSALYARQGVPEYWVVDLERAQIVCHVDPCAGTYSRVEAVAFGSDVRALTIPGLTVATTGLTSR